MNTKKMLDVHQILGLYVPTYLPTYYLGTYVSCSYIYRSASLVTEELKVGSGY